MGPTLARMAKRAAPGKRVVGVARFSDRGGPRPRSTAPGVETIACDLLDRRARRGAAEARQRRLHGRHEVRRLRQSGADLGHERARAGDRGGDLRRLAHRRLLHGLRLSVRARRRRRRHRGGAAVPPPGDYANSCAGRERMFEHFSARLGTPGRIVRLNYAIDMRYGVLHDIATQGARRRADRPRHGPRQRHLAGRRQRGGAALPRPHHRGRPRRSTSRGPRPISVRWLAEELGRASVARRSSRAARRRPAGSAMPRAWWPSSAPPRVPLDAHDRLDGGLARARRRQPRQADALRGARWAVLAA